MWATKSNIFVGQNFRRLTEMSLFEPDEMVPDEVCRHDIHFKCSNPYPKVFTGNLLTKDLALDTVIFWFI